MSVCREKQKEEENDPGGGVKVFILVKVFIPVEPDSPALGSGSGSWPSHLGDAPASLQNPFPAGLRADLPPLGGLLSRKGEKQEELR